MKLDAYDAGFLGGDDSCTTEWWRDYLRLELARAHDFYQGQIDLAENCFDLDYCISGLVKLQLNTPDNDSLMLTPYIEVQKISNSKKFDYIFAHVGMDRDSIDLAKHAPVVLVTVYFSLRQVKNMLFNKDGLLLVERYHR